MAVTFGYEYFTVSPDSVEVAKGILIPWCKDCSKQDIKQAVGIVGSVCYKTSFTICIEN